MAAIKFRLAFKSCPILHFFQKFALYRHFKRPFTKGDRVAGLKAPKRAMRREREGMYLQGAKGAVSIQGDLRLPI